MQVFGVPCIRAPSQRDTTRHPPPPNKRESWQALLIDSASDLIDIASDKVHATMYAFRHEMAFVGPLGTSCAGATAKATGFFSKKANLILDKPVLSVNPAFTRKTAGCFSEPTVVICRVSAEDSRLPHSAFQGFRRMDNVVLYWICTGDSPFFVSILLFCEITQDRVTGPHEIPKSRPRA